MSIVRIIHNKENPYVTINKKALWDKELSLNSVGLWARLLSRPDDWKIKVTELMKSCQVGRHTIDKCMNELIKAGYAIRRQTRKKVGNREMAGPVEYDVFEFKLDEDSKKEYQLFDSQLAEDQLAEDQHLLSNKETNSSSLRSEEEQIPKEGSNSASPLSTVSADADALCKFFLEKIKERKKDFKQPDLKNWKSSMDLLLRKDKRDYQETLKMIEWASTHKWWKIGCLSPDKLRAKYDEMSMQMDGEKEGNRIRKNREFALKMKQEHPKELYGLSFDAKFVCNTSTAKEISFNMEEEAFQNSFLSLFGGRYE